MDELLKIGEFLAGEVGCKVKGITAFAPLYADFNTDKPFIVYQRDDLRLQRDKDGYELSSTTVTLFIVTDSYSSGVSTLADVVGVISGLTAYDIDIINSTEFADGGSFVQTLTITISR